MCAHVRVTKAVDWNKFYLYAFAIVPGPGENDDDFEWISSFRTVTDHK